MADPKPRKPPASAQIQTEVYSLYLNEEQEDRRSFRTSVTVAVVVHLGILWVSIPELYSKPIEPPPEKKVFVVSQDRWKKPPVRQEEPRKLQAKKVPVPSLNPDQVEPLVVEVEPVTMEVTDLTDTVVGIPELPPDPEPAVVGPIRVGDGVSKPIRIHHVQPRYTEVARKARIQGTVILEATIDRQGNVVDIKVLKGLPLGLDTAAVDAVSQWRYEPSVMNGKPVPVLYVLTVHFTLS